MINNATIIREKRKTLKIIIDENKGLIVVAPNSTKIEKISEILEKKRAWIERNLNKRKKLQILILQHIEKQCFQGRSTT